jgi:hypothetical protein
MRFDPDHRFRPRESLAPIVSAEWWNGLLEHLRRGSRIVADPSTGLQVVPGTDNQTIALAGSYPLSWAKAASGVPGAIGAAMGSATVRLWIADNAGLRTDAGIDVLAFNGSASSVAADVFLLVQKVGNLWVVVWEECAT